MEFDHHVDIENDAAYPVKIWEVEFSQRAMITIGLAVKDIAAYLGVSERDVTKGVQPEMFRLEPSGMLMLIFPVPGEEAEMVVHIPKGQWRLK